MATVEECAQALDTLAAQLAAKNPARRTRGFDRTLSCTIRDLDVTFRGQLHDGLLSDIRQASDARAQIRLALSGDDLVELVGGRLNLASAWASGRVKVQAGVRDMIKLRTIF